MTAVLPFWWLVTASALAAAAGCQLARLFDPLPRWAEPVAALVAGAIAFGLGGEVTIAALAWTVALALPLAALAANDAASHRMPDLLSFALLALGLGRLAFSGDPILPILLVSAALVALGLAVDRFIPDGPVGAGDFLLVAGALAWLGFGPLLELFLLAAVLLWLHFLAVILLHLTGRMARDGDGIPFAPAFAASLFALWVAGLG